MADHSDLLKREMLLQQQRKLNIDLQNQARIKAMMPPSALLCQTFLDDAREFHLSLPDGLEMLATVVLSDGSFMRLRHIEPRNAHHVLCTGESRGGLPVQVLASCDAATLKLEAVLASEPEAKQARCGFLAQVREDSLALPRE